MINAEIICDSEWEVNGKRTRLMTFVLRYPRFIHGEVMTHRSFSRNAASSRAIPVRKMLSAIIKDPVVPVEFGRNRSGMQARESLPPFKAALARRLWLSARWPAVAAAWTLSKLGLHKQHANRIVEPWQWMTTIVTCTEEAFRAFLELRNHEDAQPEIQVLARKMLDTEQCSTSYERNYHLPFVTIDEIVLALSASDLNVSLEEMPYKTFSHLSKLSAARCCRVSYDNVDGSSSNIDNDLVLFRKLVKHSPLHASPFEHQAFAGHVDVDDVIGVAHLSRNFDAPWIQNRAFVEARHG